MARSSGATILTEIGTDITGLLRPSLLSVSVTQRLHGRADEVSIKLEDRDGTWRQDWKPSPGDAIRVRYSLSGWREEGDDRRIDWGLFEIDKVRLQGAPSRVTVGAQSASVTRSMRHQKRTQAWQETTLKGIASEIAGRHDLQLRYGADRVPKHERLDQDQTPDLRFLRRQAERWNLSLRVDDDRLIITSDGQLEVLSDPAHRSAVGGGAEEFLTCTRFELEEKTYELAGKCVVTYDDAIKAKKMKREVSDPAVPDTAETLTVNERVRSPDQCRLRAAANLERHNRERFVAQLSLPGRPQVRPGFLLPIEGFGRFDGDYVIDEATHKISRSGYETDASLRKKREPLA